MQERQLAASWPGAVTVAVKGEAPPFPGVALETVGALLGFCVTSPPAQMTAG